MWPIRDLHIGQQKRENTWNGHREVLISLCFRLSLARRSYPSLSWYHCTRYTFTVMWYWAPNLELLHEVVHSMLTLNVRFCCTIVLTFSLQQKFHSSQCWCQCVLGCLGPGDLTRHWADITPLVGLQKWQFYESPPQTAMFLLMFHNNILEPHRFTIQVQWNTAVCKGSIALKQRVLCSWGKTRTLFLERW